MSGVILENLSGRKLCVLVSVLLILQVACFMIGGLIAPTPFSAEQILGSKCLDLESNESSWFYIRGKGKCNTVHYLFDKNENSLQRAEQIVFSFQLPTPRDNFILDYSRWQQNLIGVLEFDIVFHSDYEMPPNIPLTMHVKLGYRNKEDDESDWKLYSSAVVQRRLDCMVEPKKTRHVYNCALVPLFDSGSLHHDFYLINMRMPVDETEQINDQLGHIDDITLVVINQNGGFTKVWLTLKSTFFPLVILTAVWFWNRVRLLNRSPVLLEYMILSLCGALTFLNTPLEILTLFFDLPFMPLMQDIRQGIFYAMLLSFWLVFAGEHLMIHEPQPRHLLIYWKHLSAVLIGCVSLLIFDVCEKGGQVWNPFYSIWVTDIGTNLALSFIICAAISAGIYFIFLCYMIWTVFHNISVKRTALPSMSSVRRLHYEGIIYRFKFLMLATLTCAAMTVVGFILGQVSEGRWKWDDDLHIEYTSAFFTGVYGMWNIYILALTILYSPSHKHWPSEADLNSAAGDEIALCQIPGGDSEISVLTSFATKSATD